MAVYVPKRTLVRADASTIESQDQYQFTFDETTIPTAVQVGQLIEDGCAWVGARVSPLHTSMEGLARAACALLVAAWIERSWPEDDDALQRAKDMEARLDKMLADLVDANNAAGGTDDFGLEIVNPVYSFPVADLRWDYPTYW
ncbi:MAG: hypothetical protein ABW022_08555 [Actinoplanes sp.]